MWIIYICACVLPIYCCGGSPSDQGKVRRVLHFAAYLFRGLHFAAHFFCPLNQPQGANKVTGWAIYARPLRVQVSYCRYHRYHRYHRHQEVSTGNIRADLKFLGVCRTSSIQQGRGRSACVSSSSINGNHVHACAAMREVCNSSTAVLSTLPLAETLDTAEAVESDCSTRVSIQKSIPRKNPTCPPSLPYFRTLSFALSSQSVLHDFPLSLAQ